MLSVFKAQPIVELKQRDKSRIQSILVHSDQLLVGLNTGSLRIYRVNNPPASPDPTPTATSAPTPTKTKGTELLREYEKFSKYGIEQLAIFREANILITLSNGIVSIHDLGTYTLQEQLTKAKGANIIAAISNVEKDANTEVNALVSRLAVAVKRRLLVWSWQDGELVGDVTELALPSSIKALTWSTGTKIIAGLNTQFLMVDIESQNIKNIVGPGSIGGAPGQDSGRLGGTMSYIGMGAMIPVPLATGLGKDEMLLARDTNTHFINRDGDAIGRRQIPWRTAPQAIGYSYPFLLALQDGSKGALEVRNPETLTLLQTIELPGASLLQVPNPNISLAHQGKGFVVASEQIIWRMQGFKYAVQIDALVTAGSFDEAISLLGLIEDTLINDKPGRVREIKMLKAQHLFDEKQFREAMDLFGEVAAPPERVIRLYPRIIAGDLVQEDEEDTKPESPTTPKSSPAKKGHKKTDSVGSYASPKKHESDKGDASSVRSGKPAPPASEVILADRDLKPAVKELQSFLADIRRRLQRFLEPDQSVKSLSEVQEAAQSENIKEMTEHLLGVPDINEISDLGDKILETAILVDTTLFRVYMFATPSLAGSLFRISNFCDPDVVMTKLEQSERYNDLIDFLYGKRLHRQALERLQKFGQAEATKEIDSQLYGPGRTVSYLQNLPPGLVDLILEFAKWPLETDPQMGMEIFLADTENAESLPRDKVLSFLETFDKSLALKYLEHVVDELNDMTPELHQKLLMLYLAELKSFKTSDANEFLEKFVTLLRNSTQYSPAKILESLPKDDPIFYEARAIVFRKIGNHRQALEIYVFKLNDPAKAEEYCNQLHLEESNDPAKSSRGRKTVADTVDEQQSIYHVLLNLYLNPPKGEQARWGPAIDLMARHGSRLPASSTLEMIPADLLVKELEFYFRGRIRNSNSIMNESKIESGLRKVDAVRVQAGLLLGEGFRAAGGRARKVRIDEDRVCGVCYKRLGGSVISVFPDNSVVHLGCASRKQNEQSAT